MIQISDFAQPVLVLSPMDGVTDSPFRQIVKKYGNPDLIYTEFSHVTGFCAAADNIIETFNYGESERLVIAQIYGTNPDHFYQVAKALLMLGFDGLDINMGCPAKNVASSGAGAGLIRTPDLALQIINSVKKAVEDWVNNDDTLNIPERSLKSIYAKREFNTTRVNEHSKLTPGVQNLLAQKYPQKYNRVPVSVSVKTRIGYDTPITESWISHLSSAKPNWITVHGRTLKQMYTGRADWNELAKAVKATPIPILVNGDIKSKADLDEVLSLTGSKGAFIGRGVFGNPWIFKELRGESFSEITVKDKLDVMLEHARKFVNMYPEEKVFVQLRKHFGWYCKGFENASEIRTKLMEAKNINDVESILSQFGTL